MSNRLHSVREGEVTGGWVLALKQYDIVMFIILYFNSISISNPSIYPCVCVYIYIRSTWGGIPLPILYYTQAVQTTSLHNAIVKQVGGTLTISTLE